MNFASCFQCNIVGYPTRKDADLINSRPERAKTLKHTNQQVDPI